MAGATTRTARPTRAERIRSIMTSAASLSLTTQAACYDLIAVHTVDQRGRLSLHVPGESPLAAEAVCSPQGALPALLQFTDIAPVAVRDRLRARVSLSGALTTSVTQPTPGALVLRFDAGQAAVECDGAVERVGLRDLALAEPDPLAREEAGLLTHLDAGHPDVIEHLGRLADPPAPQNALRVRPYALDRYGFTLRCEDAAGHRDVRVPFPAPLHTADEIGPQVDRLLSRPRSRHCPHGRGADG
ncbi:DUF2470 domain-containing protein [Streptomyces sp. PR69]|uniref:DUF2470 domain-containing protein n=1 Tax=Streptomyces sp. PR69 TaxID=2984950 RepID=UPI0022648748|nr:DUF2470 domain-containing protein [Streptomyces sp. PR69]